jgi:alkanesulfonate monooxygenase SsuD/methylene tetrahydromethanopterin reductase-like flavin-dependent oxidoreductase (luciferase family)
MNAGGGRAAMEFGMFHEFPALEGRSQADAFAEALEQCAMADRWGLDAIWLAELHGAPRRSVLSAPLGVANAVAVKTERLKIGIAVQVLPLCHPLRLAEEVATVDQVSRGRLIFGVGRSGVVRTYEDYGVSYDESRDRFAETLEILKGLWTEDRFSYDGKYHRFRDVTLVPKPYQQPYPEIRIAAASADTFAQIGRLGCPIFVAVRHGTFAELLPSLREYRAAHAAAGHPGHGRVYLRVPAYLAETERQAHDEPRDSLMGFYQQQADLAVDSARRSSGPGAEQRIARAERLRRLTYEDALASQVIAGTPDSFSARLREVEEELGLDGILAELNCGGHIPHAQVLTAIRLLCREVMPRFR